MATTNGFNAGPATLSPDELAQLKAKEADTLVHYNEPNRLDDMAIDEEESVREPITDQELKRKLVVDKRLKWQTGLAAFVGVIMGAVATGTAAALVQDKSSNDQGGQVETPLSVMSKNAIPTSSQTLPAGLGQKVKEELPSPDKDFLNRLDEAGLLLNNDDPVFNYFSSTNGAGRYAQLFSIKIPATGTSQENTTRQWQSPNEFFGSSAVEQIVAIRFPDVSSRKIENILFIGQNGQTISVDDQLEKFKEEMRIVIALPKNEGSNQIAYVSVGACPEDKIDRSVPRVGVPVKVNLKEGFSEIIELSVRKCKE